MKNKEITECTSWNCGFLNRFVVIQKNAQVYNSWALYEKVSDYEVYFNPKSSFSKNHDWSLWILTIGGVDVARIGTSHPKKNSKLTFLGVGYYETLPDVKPEDLALLFEKVEQYARKKELLEIRLPLQGGFFGSYRARIETQDEPYFGEPQTLDRYLGEWQSLGYSISKKWTSFDIDLETNRLRSESFLNLFYKSNKIPELRFDQIGQNDFKNDLIRLLNLFNESYKNFDEYSDIDPEDFISMYSQYEFILKNYFCMIVNYRGQDIGFCLAYPDILKPLLFAQKYKLPDILRKISVLIYLKFFKLRYYYPYQGKIPDSPRVKGFPMALLAAVSNSLPDYVNNISGHYIADGNPVLTMLSGESSKPKNKFAIFKKSLI